MSDIASFLKFPACVQWNCLLKKRKSTECRPIMAKTSSRKVPIYCLSGRSIKQNSIQSIEIWNNKFALEFVCKFSNLWQLLSSNRIFARSLEGLFMNVDFTPSTTFLGLTSPRRPRPLDFRSSSSAGEGRASIFSSLFRRKILVEGI